MGWIECWCWNRRSLGHRGVVLRPVLFPLSLAAYMLAACGADGPPIRPEPKTEKRQIVQPVGPQPGTGGSTDPILGE